jgi:hypothetical protein
MTFQTTDWFYSVSGDVIDEDKGHYTRPGYGPNSPDSTLAADGHYRLWIDSTEQPGQYYNIQQGMMTVSGQRVERTDTWIEWTAEQKRQAKNAEIDQQIPQPSYAQSVRDSLASRDVLLAESAATAKRLELENTADENLPDFDATLTPAEPEAGDHCRLSLEIARLPEWAGQPGADVGFRATLEIQESHEDDGATARMIFTEIPTNEEGGVLGPFIQQPAPNDKIWILDSRDGYHWTDPDLVAAGYLFWDSGTRKVTPVLTAHGIGEGAVRSSVLVDYTVT